MGKPMLEVEPTGHLGYMVTESGRNSNKASPAPFHVHSLGGSASIRHS